MDNKIVILIVVALVGGSIFGFTGAYFFYFPQLKYARQEIDILTTKLELALPDEPISSSTGQGAAPDLR